MARRALFPGSFDPIHFGHIDIGCRAAHIFDELYVGVYASPSKNVLFSIEERIAFAEKAFSTLPNVTVCQYSGLTIQFAKKIGAAVMVRGLRVFSDFEYEFRMALTNQSLDGSIETISLITAHANTFISSSTVKEVAALKGNVGAMVPEYVNQALIEKYSKSP